MLIYGLIIYFDRNVKRAYEMAEQGMTRIRFETPETGNEATSMPDTNRLNMFWRPQAISEFVAVGAEIVPHQLN